MIIIRYITGQISRPDSLETINAESGVVHAEYLGALLSKLELGRSSVFLLLKLHLISSYIVPQLTNTTALDCRLI